MRVRVRVRVRGRCRVRGRRPCAWSSAMAALSCGIDADMFGNLMMLACRLLTINDNDDGLLLVVCVVCVMYVACAFDIIDEVFRYNKLCAHTLAHVGDTGHIGHVGHADRLFGIIIFMRIHTWCPLL